jgi:hypothetical protein
MESVNGEPREIAVSQRGLEGLDGKCQRRAPGNCSQPERIGWKVSMESTGKLQSAREDWTESVNGEPREIAVSQIVWTESVNGVPREVAVSQRGGKSSSGVEPIAKTHRRVTNDILLHKMSAHYGH